MTDKPKMTFIDCSVTSFLSVSFYFPFQPIIAAYCCCSCLPCHLSAAVAAVAAAQCLISINANDSKQQQKKASTFSNSSTCFFLLCATQLFWKSVQLSIERFCCCCFCAAFLFFKPFSLFVSWFLSISFYLFFSHFAPYQLAGVCVVTCSEWQQTHLQLFNVRQSPQLIRCQSIAGLSLRVCVCFCLCLCLFTRLIVWSAFT